MATWFAVPGVIFSAHAIEQCDDGRERGSPRCRSPSRMPRIEAITTPANTPMLRSIAFVERLVEARLHDEQRGDRGEHGRLARDQRAGDEPGGRVATADLPTCRIGVRWDARMPAVTRIPRA